ncbi:putative PEP-CTERM system TPR-repeat lipoprotein [Salinivirga cyanobacteriivorans]|uniref:Putative PEP-CTERM system TPR-repeat lipoprotein n=1 Tax=Salinivirga cyanobacteriivorans TaxID=1307839 RepID=A0A0S2HXK6_9BACT|nr:hypothetical protein [Salinivirga cyanobacteriivorans]ALO14816.1 putative PEP-CTERM system TPR-repeat lipoprotein [Salinivirga cyanobacteriivorans]
MRAFIIILLFISVSSFSQNEKLYDSLLAEFNYTELLDTTLKKVAQDSNDVIALTYLATAAEKQYLENIALDTWQKVVALDSNNYKALSGCKRLLLKKDKYKAALLYADRMNDLKPGQIRNYRDLARIKYKLKQYEQSIQWCDTSLMMYSPNPTISDLKAHNLLALNDTIAALKIWCDLTTKHYTEQYARQLTFNAAGHQWNDTVQNLMSELAVIDSLNPYLPKMHGYLLFRKKEYAEAVIMFRKSMELGDSTAFNRRFMGMSAFNSGDYSSAYELLGSLKDVEQNNSLYYMMSISHAHVYADTTSHRLLVNTYQKFFDPPFVAGILSEISETTKSIGDKYDRRGKDELAEDYFQMSEKALYKARKIHYSNKNNLRLAMLYDIYTKDLKKALKYYKRFAENHSDTASPNFKFSKNRIIRIKEELHFKVD